MARIDATYRPSCGKTETQQWDKKKANWRYKSNQLERQLAEDNDAWSELNKINLTEFMHKTRPRLTVWKCKLGHKDCRYSWRSVRTYIGTCLELRPANVKKGILLYYSILYYTVLEIFS